MERASRSFRWPTIRPAVRFLLPGLSVAITQECSEIRLTTKPSHPRKDLDRSLDGLHSEVARTQRLRQRIRSFRPAQRICSVYSLFELYNRGRCGIVISNARLEAPQIFKKHYYGQGSRIRELILARIHGTLKDRQQHDHREPPRGHWPDRAHQPHAHTIIAALYA